MANEQPRARRKPGRVPTSCAECRRLKLKCDRNIPCEKCVSRGCGQICPDGVLATGRGNRLVLANTKELHDEIAHLRSRVRELEDGLRAVQGTVALSPHPLLSPELLKIKSGTIPNRAPENQPNEPDSTPSISTLNPVPVAADSGQNANDTDFIDSFGTLSIGAHGEFTFLGKSARSEYLLRALAPPNKLTEPDFPRISSKISKSGCSDLEMNKTVAEEVFSHLPLMSESIRLAELYLENGRYFYVPIPREQLFDEIMTNIYRADSVDEFESPQALSLLFAIFALGALYDPLKSPYNVESLEYLHLARTAYGLVSEQTTLIGIQAVSHMCSYMDLSNAESNLSHPLWSFVGHNAQLARGIGLHLDSARWKLAPEVAHRRSLTFWSLFVFDTWTSFCLGRPPSLSLAFVDCPLPKDYQTIQGANGESEIGYHTWTFQYSRFMHRVMETAFGSATPSYPTILTLDRQIREFYVPPHLQPFDKEDEPHEQTVYMQRWHVLASKEYTLMHLHRGYFAQALRESPSRVATHRFLPSVMATYRSAWRIGQMTRCAWRNVPSLACRSTMCWSQALTAGLVMCIIATQAPNSQMGDPALDELNLLVGLFEAAAPTCRAAAHSLSAMQNLRTKGHEASGQPRPNTHITDPLPSHELERLGGQTRLVSTSGKLSEDDPSGVPAIISSTRRDNENNTDTNDTQQEHIPPSSSEEEQHMLFMSNSWPPMTLLPPQSMHPAIIQDFDSSLENLISAGLSGAGAGAGTRGNGLEGGGGGGGGVQTPPQFLHPQQQQQQRPPQPIFYPHTDFSMSYNNNTTPIPSNHHQQSFHDFSMFQETNGSSWFSGTSPSLMQNGSRMNGGGGGGGGTLVSNGSGTGTTETSTPTTTPPGSNPAYLDETWQNFVEQLGF